MLCKGIVDIYVLYMSYICRFYVIYVCVVFPVCVINFCYKIAKHNSSTQDYIHAGDYTLYHT